MVGIVCVSAVEIKRRSKVFKFILIFLKIDKKGDFMVESKKLKGQIPDINGKCLC